MTVLLMDGVLYSEWLPKDEQELEDAVREHSQNIFGENSIFLEKRKMKSVSGIGTIPDGFAITFGNKPEWHVVEVELSGHPLHDHIAAQISKFISGLSNPAAQKKLTDSIYTEIIDNDLLKLQFAHLIKPSTELYRFLVNLISQPPVITIVIEKQTEDLEEVLRTLSHPFKRVIQFQTFARVNAAPTVHAHLFEPLCQTVESTSRPLTKKAEPTNRTNSTKGELYQSFFRELVQRYATERPLRFPVKALPQCYLGFGAGKSGLWFEWVFRENNAFTAELWIGTKDGEKNRQYLQTIRRNPASRSLPDLSWNVREGRKNTVAALYTKGDIFEVTADPDNREQLLSWAVQNMKKLVDTLGPVVKTL